MFNIHSCIGAYGQHDPDRIVGVLRELEADVIALQEVDSYNHRGLELLDWLFEQTGLHAIPGPTLIKHSGHYGNALLTRFQARRVRRLDLSFPGHEPRGAIDADLECGSIRLQVVATHLGLRPAERRFQTERLLSRFSTTHCALLGDLNEWFLWGRPLRWLKKIFGKTPARPTFPAWCPIFALDRTGCIPCPP